MTIQAHRTRTTGPARPSEPEGRPLPILAAVAGVGAAVIGLLVAGSLALTGWFLADAGAHGDTTDALRVGAAGWLMGHGSDLVLDGAPIGVSPLALTMVVALTAFRCARWSSRQAAPVADDRALGVAVATFACSYVVVAVIVGVVASGPRAELRLGAAVLGAVLVAGLAGGAGLAVGSGRLDTWIRRAPYWVVDVVCGAVAGVLWLVAAGAALVAVSLLLSLNEAATVLSGLDLGVGDALSYTVVVVLFAPNAVLLGSAYLLGPGFAVGTGTSVSPAAVSLGAVPAFPLFAALPDEGPAPGWLAVAYAVPVLAGALGAAAALRRHGPTAHDLAALRGAVAGFGAGLAVTVLVALAGGPLGTGRMAEIGAPAAEVLVFATGLMSVGGLLGAALQNWWRRRSGEPLWRPPVDPAEEPTQRILVDRAPNGHRPADPGDEPTVEVLR